MGMPRSPEYHITSDFYASTKARSLAVDRKMDAYLRSAQQLLRSIDEGYIIKHFPLQDLAFQFADQHPAASQLRLVLLYCCPKKLPWVYQRHTYPGWL